MLEDHPQEHHGLSAPAGGEIVAVANAVTARADHDPTIGELVVVARTADGGHRAIGGGGLGPLRAAISVAVAAGNDRLWDGAVGTETVEHPTRTLPEIVRAAAEASNIRTSYIGCIQDESVAAVAVWFEIGGNVASPAERRSTMELLAAAADRQREFLASRAAEEVAAAGPSSDDTSTGRTFDPNDPTIDSITGLVTAADFETAVESYESDEATLVVVDLDDFTSVVENYDETTANAVLREIADRLVASCRRGDLIARVGPDTFAVLFADASRSVGLQVAKRLLSSIAAPLPITGGPEFVTATIALAHQFGLVDMDELLESADEAVASGKRSGSGRLVIAS